MQQGACVTPMGSADHSNEPVQNISQSGSSDIKDCRFENNDSRAQSFSSTQSDPTRSVRSHHAAAKDKTDLNSETNLSHQNLPVALVAANQLQLAKIIFDQSIRYGFQLCKAANSDELTQRLLTEKVSVVFLSEEFIERYTAHTLSKLQQEQLIGLIKRIKVVSPDSSIVMISERCQQPSISAEFARVGVSAFYSLEKGLGRFALGIEAFLTSSIQGLNPHKNQNISVNAQRRLTQRGSAETNHSANQKFIRRLIRNIPGNVLLVDHQRKILLASDSCESMLGYPKKSLNGQMLSELFLPKLFQEISNLLENISPKQGQKIQEFTIDSIVLDQTGEGIPVRCLMRPMQFAGQQGFVMTLQDLSTSLDEKADSLAQLNWQYHLKDYARKFIHLPISHFSKEIKLCLQDSAQLLGCERVYLYKVNREDRAAYLSFEWTVHSESLNTFSEKISLEARADEFKMLADNKSLLLTPRYNMKTKQLAQNLGMTEHLATVGAESSFVVPMSYKNTVFGWVGFDIQSNNRQWQPADLDNIEELTGLINQAILRKRQEQLRHAKYKKMVAAQGKLSQQASLDSLTGLANRRNFDKVFASELGRAARQGSDLSIMICDIDFFKEYNDTYGHLAGDKCLQQVAKTIARAFQRAADFVARFGGEEFVVILPGLSMRDAFDAADRMRKMVYELNIAHPSSPLGRLSISVGLTCESSPSPECAQALVEKADRALYRAKYRGKNRVYAYTKQSG